jgi:ribosomal protein L12E/L44/L45/RPP1/RPP2
VAVIETKAATKAPVKEEKPAKKEEPKEEEEDGGMGGLFD